MTPCPPARRDSAVTRDEEKAKLLKTQTEYSALSWHAARTWAVSSRGNHAQVHTPFSFRARNRCTAFVCARPQSFLHHLRRRRDDHPAVGGWARRRCAREHAGVSPR